MNLKILIYCTKGKPYLLHMPKDKEEFEKGIEFSLTSGEEFKQACIDIKNHSLNLNGKIVAECDFEVEEIIHTYENGNSVHHHYNTKTLDNEQLLRKSCIIGQAIDDYLGNRQYNENNNVVGYAIHIKNLEIFDKPKELKDFYIKGAYHNAEQMFTDEIQINGEWFHPIKKAPQNMCYTFDCYGNKYIVMSTQPQWVALILNGLKTIEVRRKVLKEMM